MRPPYSAPHLPGRAARIFDLLIRVGQGAAIAGGLAGCLSDVHADQVVWVAHGTTDQIMMSDPFGLALGSPGNFFSLDGNGTGYVFANWMFPNTPGGTSGRFVSATSQDVARMTHAVVADQLHPSRSIRLEWSPTSDPSNTGSGVLLESLRITTRGDLTIQGEGHYGSYGWIVRDPQCTGSHLISTSFLDTSNAWIAGTGHLMLDAHLFGSPFAKMGPGTLIINPSPHAYYPGFGGPTVGPFIVRDGTLAFWGTGEPPLINADRPEPIQIGAEFGGSDYPPNSIPSASWSPFPIPPVPPVKSPRVLIQADNVVAASKIVRMGFNSILRFEAPDPISFLGNVVSDLGGNATRIECKANAFEAVSFAATSLNQFFGTFSIEGGVARLSGTPNAQISFFLSAPTYPYEAMLEFGPSGSYAFSNSISGFGRVSKYGPGTLTFSADTTNFTGDFLLQEGTILIPTGAPASTLRNSVTVSGPSTVLSQQINTAIDPAATVKLDDSATWRLNARSNVISQLVLVNNARVELGNGLANVAGGSVQTLITPGFANTATIAGPGTLSSAGPITFDTGRGSNPADLDVQANIFAPSLIFTGLGSVRLSGPGAGAPPITVRMGTVRLHRTGANNATGAISIGNPAGPATDAALLLDANDQLSDTATVIMNTRAALNLNGFSDVIGGLNVNGPGPFYITTSDGVNAGEFILAGNATFSGTGTTTFSGALNMLAGARTFTLNTGASVVLSGAAYSGTLLKIGSGNLRLDALDGAFTLNNSGTTTSAGAATVGGLTGNGTIRIDTSLTCNVIAPAQPAFGGALTGTGMFIKSGPGTQEFNSPVANTYTGGTRVEGGTLFLNRAPGNTVIPGNATIASGGTLLFAGGASNQIADTADVTVESGGTVDMAGQTETVRSAVVSGTWNIDNANGTPGNLAATQSIFVAGGTLTGNISGGPLTISTGTARVRGTVPSAAVNLLSTLSVGGFSGSDQLTITGGFNLSSNTSTLKFTTGVATDPALIRALGSLSYPVFGSVIVKVDQFIPQRVGTAIKLIDFGTGSSAPQLSRYALAAPAAGSGRGVLTLNNRNLSYVVTRNPCPADFDGSRTATVQDIFDFLSTWFAGTPGSDFNQSGGASVQDIFDFLAAWFQGCP